MTYKKDIVNTALQNAYNEAASSHQNLDPTNPENEGELHGYEVAMNVLNEVLVEIVAMSTPDEDLDMDAVKKTVSSIYVSGMQEAELC